MLESDGISGWSIPNPGFTKMESEVQQREDMRAQWEPELDPKASQRPLLFGGREMLARGEFVSLVTRKAKTGLATGPVGAAVCAPCPLRLWDAFQVPSELARVQRICSQDKQHQDLGWSIWIPAPVPFSCHRSKIKVEVLARFQGLFLRQTQYP